MSAPTPEDPLCDCEACEWEADTERRASEPMPLPCPWCGQPWTVRPGDECFEETDGGKRGRLEGCCAPGPAVRTNYRPVAEWRRAAIEAWNRRPPLPTAQPVQVDVQLATPDADSPLPHRDGG